jgi:hypothetical protein
MSEYVKVTELSKSVKKTQITILKYDISCVQCKQSFEKDNSAINVSGFSTSDDGDGFIEIGNMNHPYDKEGGDFMTVLKKVPHGFYHKTCLINIIK